MPTAIDYSLFPSLVTQSSQLYVGMIYWHVYGHLAETLPTRETVLEVDYKNPVFMGNRHQHIPTFLAEVMLRGVRPYRTSHCYGDVGLDGINHNHNRCFLRYMDAIHFQSECARLGIAKTYEQLKKEDSYPY